MLFFAFVSLFLPLGVHVLRGRNQVNHGARSIMRGSGMSEGFITFIAGGWVGGWVVVGGASLLLCVASLFL